MRHWLPVLVLLAGLGSLISCKSPATRSIHSGPTGPLNVTAQAPRRIGTPSNDLNPFDRYLADAKTNWPEQALLRFASQCKVDLDATAPKFAQSPNDKWIPVKDFSGALKDQETDFYGTVEVWHQVDRVLVERWGMELDTGDYYRLLYCFEQKKTTLAESVSWSVEFNNDSSKDSGWGYDHRWKLGPGVEFVTTQKSFVDLHEQPMAAPKLDAETMKSLNDENMGVKTWADLELPDELLR